MMHGGTDKRLRAAHIFEYEGHVQTGRDLTAAVD